MKVIDKNHETKSAIMSVSISGLKIFSGKPPTNISGNKMAIVAIVPANTGLSTSFVPFVMASSSFSCPSLRCRSMFSSTTTASSVSIPSAKIIAV